MTMLNWQRTGGHARVLLVATSHGQLGETGNETGAWLSELSHPFFILHDSGVQVDICSVAGGEVPIDPRGRGDDDPDNRRFLADNELMQAISSTPALRDVDTSDYQGIFFAGGHGAMWDFPEDSAVQRAAAAVFEAGDIVAAVCHGAAALVNAKLSDGQWLVQGKKLTAFSNREERDLELHATVPFLLEDMLRERGAHFTAEEPWLEHVVDDGNLITGQNPASAKITGIAMVKRLRAGEKP